MRRPSMAAHGAWLLVAGCIGGCDRQESAEPSARPIQGSDLGEEVVSTVEGVPITVEDVVEVMRTTGLPSREALRRLQRYYLLLHEAQRRGFETHAGVRRARSKAAVQALLIEEVERPHPSDDDIEGRFERLVRLVTHLESRHLVTRNAEAMEDLDAWAKGEVP